MIRITPEGLEIEELISKIHISHCVVDLGARLQGSNSRHLVSDHGFEGIFVEMNPKHAEGLRNTFPESEVHHMAVSPENVNEVVPERTGVLCIDIDGNDYWVWKAIKATPEIVVIETGRPKRVKDPQWIAPYDPSNPKRHDGTADRPMKELAENKGYTFYKKISVNLIFLRNDIYAAIHASS